MTRVIKKYPNRRLYDTEESRYITLGDIRDLVNREIDFSVFDKKSGADITRTILLQVISEQEQHGDPVLSETFLAHVIRAYGSGAPGLLARHLEQSLAAFIGQPNHLLEQVKQVVGGDVSHHVAHGEVCSAAVEHLETKLAGSIAEEDRCSEAGAASKRLAYTLELTSICSKPTLLACGEKGAHGACGPMFAPVMLKPTMCVR